MLSPVLIFGSGVHHQWLCDQAIAVHCLESQAMALRSWDGLLRLVAERLNIAQAIDEELGKEMPTLQWERLVQAHCDRGDKSFRAYESERVLRKTLCEILLEAEREVEPAVDFGKILELREVLGQLTISLNLDTLLSREQPGKLGASTSLKKCLGVLHPGGTVWFPHGSALRPPSATLGLRDYGALAPFWEKLIQSHKAWQREKIESKAQDWSRATFTRIINSTGQLQSESLGSMIAHVMLAPLVIFGAGIRREEWGIWWLLNQRARNLA